MTDVKLGELEFTYEDFKAHCDCDFGSGDAPQHDEDNCQIGGIIAKANRILAEKLAKAFQFQCDLSAPENPEWEIINKSKVQVTIPHPFTARLVCIEEVEK